MNDRRPNDTDATGHEPAPTRRSFLSRGVIGAGLALPTLVMARTATAKPAPKAAQKTSRTRPVTPTNKLTGLNAVLIEEVMNDEAQHVPILQKLLNDSGNPLPVPIRAMPNFNMARLVQPTLQDFLETAAGFENTGSGFYGGALLNITQTPEYFPTAVGLCTVESRHASWLNSLLNQSLVPNFVPVEAPIRQDIVLSRVTEFVTDPRSTFPSFDTTVVSDANNFSILDFLLFLEYIESTFYAVNVPRFIG